MAFAQLPILKNRLVAAAVMAASRLQCLEMAHLVLEVVLVFRSRDIHVLQHQPR
jgi:hypothetical protein